MFEPIRIDAHNPGPMTGAGNATYLLAGTRAATLVDAGTGAAAHLDDLRAELAGRGVPLTHVLVTHAHGDHASGAPALAAEHASASFFKHPWPGEDERYPVAWQRVADGDELPAGTDALTALHTPGHSPDHMAFWHEPTRTIFSGDLVIHGSSVMIHTSRGGNLGQYMASLERMLALAPARLLPAHGPEITDPGRLLREYLAHRRARERQVLDALGRALDTVPSIAESIYHGLDPALLPAARENVLAHLEQLEREGRVVRTVPNETAARWRLSR